MAVFKYLRKYIILGLLAFFLIPSFVQAKIPNDPNVLQWAFEHLGVYDAWDYATGSHEVTVAIIDNGFDMNHPDLVGNVWQNLDEIEDNGIDDDNNGYIDDVWGWDFLPEDRNNDGYIDELEKEGDNNPVPDVSVLSDIQKDEGIFNHGTLVAGIIGAKGNNGLDGAGINWKVKLMNLRVMSNAGAGDVVPMLDAIYYAVDNGADIINISIVGGVGEVEFKKAINYAYKKGVAVFAAAGNDTGFLNDYPYYPVCSDNGCQTNTVIGVSAIDEDHRLTGFSNYGSDCINITAPGQDIKSLVRYSPEDGLNETYSTKGWQGTSFSTPLVTGAAALVKSMRYDWGPEKIYNALIFTVQHTPGQDEDIYANLFGAGLLQVDRLVKYVVNTSIELVFGDNHSGKVEEYRADTKEKLSSYRRIGFEDVDDATRFLEGGEVRYATIKDGGNGERTVTVYTEKWRRAYKWNFKSNLPMMLKVADIDGDESPEIIIFPMHEDNVVYSVFSLAGERQFDYVLPQKHQGVRLDIVKNNGENQLAVFIKQNNELKIWRVNSINEIVDSFVVDTLSSVGDLAAGDIDGDGEQEYILSGDPSDGPYMAYYEKDGKYLRKFSVYEYTDFNGFSLEVLDYDGDGEEEVITIPNYNSLPVRVWNRRSKKLDEWRFLDGEVTGQIFVLQK